MIIVAPIWVTQPWYPLLLEMAIQDPLLLPNHKNLLMNPRKEQHPLLMNGTMKLAAWLISENREEQRRYQQQLPLLSRMPDQLELGKITSRPGESFVAGVVATH